MRQQFITDALSVDQIRIFILLNILYTLHILFLTQWLISLSYTHTRIHTGVCALQAVDHAVQHLSFDSGLSPLLEKRAEDVALLFRLTDPIQTVEVALV